MLIFYSFFLLSGMWNSGINAVSLQNVARKRSVNNLLSILQEKLTKEFGEQKLEL